MEVVRHQRIGMDRYIAVRGFVVKELQKKSIVGSLAEHLDFVVATLNDVEGESSNVDARTAGHAMLVASPVLTPALVV